jgi:hypothetical protein
MPSRLLDAAEALLREGRRSAAYRRRAVSTAYYAVFHALAALCADYVTRSASRSSEEYLRVYPSLDHGQLRTALGQSPVKDDGRLGRIGAIVVRLQVERQRADYLPPGSGLFPGGLAQELIDLAREVIVELEIIRPRDRRTLATCLLFKARPQ